MIGAITYEPPLRAEQDTSGSHTDAYDASQIADGNALERQTAARSYSRDYGVSVDEALRRLDRQGELSKILDQLAETESARLAGSGFAHKPDFEAWILLKGPADASSSARQIAGSHDDVVIHTGAQHTREELKQLAAELSGREMTDRTLAAGIRADMTGIGLDQRNNRIVVSIDPSKFHLHSTGDLPSGVAPSVNLIAVKAPELGHIRGGQAVGGCTSAFAVADDSDPDDEGMTTAGHCSSATEMHNHDISDVRSRFNARVDAKWFRPDDSNVAVSNLYRCSSSPTYCALDEVVYNPQEDQYVCHYGKNSGYSCGSIEDSAFAPPSPYCAGSSCQSSYLKISGDDLYGCRGDSGGPWFASGGKGIGIHSGASSSDQDNCNIVINYAIASRLGETESQLSVAFQTY